MSIAFVSKEGHLLQQVEWQRLQKDPAYRFFREFENSRIHATCEWLGVQKNSKTIPRAHWKLYRLNVENIVTTDGEGRPLDAPRRTPDPQVSREFRTMQECIDAYEDLLVRYADCEWLPSSTGEGGRQFVEKGNILVPPPPDAVDTRGLDDDIAELAGSW
ncbi:hypothetical protein AB6809_29580 [Paraburkholderia sp. RCC_158]|uniref:hypothetical protein n=1 Tax=Paraburkholderia sp. RCC_158 TaxID=3239220 RepID=UPI0035242773